MRDENQRAIVKGMVVPPVQPSASHPAYLELFDFSMALVSSTS
jgi:hypothetical protein